MNYVWLVGALWVAVIVMILRSRRRVDGDNMGVVSNQWLAEHRQAHE